MKKRDTKKQDLFKDSKTVLNILYNTYINHHKKR